ncbi:MAG TPA: MauE/DoxX family redox-associated membrane protein [Tahibacter sp.]|uniref:MauE/DoxX family redox-associated membrane protein n=1 Tax=Tahibacter sp. TaxID=2056211 RepID=UPI002C689D59|nr:MauE/DoxX family redox-associated membrane protein [Tahibacter sp.]HSX59826.1 MauE/DoxX family redox-associated membrane protein [Tahibacter sp.]
MALPGHIAEICRWWLLCALLVAAFGKTFAFARFRAELAASFPELRGGVAAVAPAIVAVEWLLVVLIACGGDPARGGMAAAAALFAAMTLVVAVALVQDRTVVCRCFGGAGHAVSGYDLLRNGLLIGAAGFGAWMPTVSGVDVFAQIALAAIGFMLFQLSTNLRDIATVLRIEAGLS